MLQFCLQEHTAYWANVSFIFPEIAAEFEPAWSVLAPFYPDDQGALGVHEWSKHGTCYTSAIVQYSAFPSILQEIQFKYFSAQLALMNRFPTPALLRQAAATNTTLTYAQLEAVFVPGSTLLGCIVDDQGRYNLAIVGLCFTIGPDSLPGQLHPCPNDVVTSSYDNNCINATEIYVPSWPF